MKHLLVLTLLLMSKPLFAQVRITLSSAQEILFEKSYNFSKEMTNSAIINHERLGKPFGELFHDRLRIIYIKLPLAKAATYFENCSDYSEGTIGHTDRSSNIVMCSLSLTLEPQIFGQLYIHEAIHYSNVGEELECGTTELEQSIALLSGREPMITGYFTFKHRKLKCDYDLWGGKFHRSWVYLQMHFMGIYSEADYIGWQLRSKIQLRDVTQEDLEWFSEIVSRSDFSKIMSSKTRISGFTSIQFAKKYERNNWLRLLSSFTIP